MIVGHHVKAFVSEKVWVNGWSLTGELLKALGSWNIERREINSRFYDFGFKRCMIPNIYISCIRL
jgi:hypothetical protein